MTYEQFTALYHSDHRNGFIWIHEEQMDIGGGKASRSDIDQLGQYKSIEKVMISGLRQDTFEYFLQQYGAQIKYLLFFKNKLVEDLSPLADLPNLAYVSFFVNQRVTKLWDMRRNTALEGLALDNFTRLHSLNGIQHAPILKHLQFGDRVWPTSSLGDIEPLRQARLLSFSFFGKAIEKMDVRIFTHMPTLKYLQSALNFFTTEELAYIVAHRPDIEGSALCPYKKFKDLIDDRDVFICGKRKPVLRSMEDAGRIERYEEKFNALVVQYRSSDATPYT